jgi:hypothetical protein
MIRVREAVKQAEDLLPEVFPLPANTELQLEGVELTDSQKIWSVTFSYLAGQAGRVYRTVRLDAGDGSFIGARNGMLPEYSS